MVANTHLQAIADLQDKVQLTGVFARNADSRDAFAKQAKQRCGYACKSYESIDEIAADKTLDFAIVTTPPNARLEIVKTLTAAKLPILMEKPIERGHPAAKQIVEIFEANDTPLGIVFQHRVRAASVKLKQLIADKALGKLRMVEVVVPWWREQSYYDEPGRGTYTRDGGGVLISQAIHTLDLLLSLTGEITEVQALCATTDFHNMESEDFVSAGLRFKNDAVGSLMATTASYPGDAESITLRFDKVVATLKSGVLTLNWRDGSQESFGADAATGGGADPMAFTSDWHRDIIADFADAIDSSRPPLATGREALKVHALIDALVESSNIKRAVAVNYD